MADQPVPDGVKTHKENLSKQIDGGGCSESWGATKEIRGSPHLSSGNTPKRRSVLKSVATGFLLSTGGRAAASSSNSGSPGEATPRQLEEAREGYESAEAVRSAIRTHAGELVDVLEEKGYLEDFYHLPTDNILDLEAYADADSATLVTATSTPQIRATAFIKVKWQTDSLGLVLLVQPQAKTSYAIVKESENRWIVDLDREQSSTTTAPCVFDDGTCYLCSSGTCTRIETYCCDNTCYQGDSLGVCTECEETCPGDGSCCCFCCCYCSRTDCY